MEPEWRASAFDWDERSLRAAPLHPSSPCRTGGAPAPAQALSNATGGSGEGSPGRQPAHASGKAVRRARSSRTPSACQVEGCGVSLENGKPFYRLQRICEQHARALYVTDASGTPQRFCQQCTRLHPVSEFEGVKRSCVVSLQRRMERKHRAQQMRAAERAAAAGGAAPPPPQRRTRAASSNRLPASAYAGTSSGEATCSPSLTPSSSGETHAHASSSGGGSGSTGHVTAVTATLSGPALQLLHAPQLGAEHISTHESVPDPLVQPAQQAGANGVARPHGVQPALTTTEIDELLVMDPDELAHALLARTGSGTVGGTHLAALASSLDAFLACSQLPPASAAPPTVLEAAASGQRHAQSELLHLMLGSGKGGPVQHAAAPALYSTGLSVGSSGDDVPASLPFGLPPSSLASPGNPFNVPPASWPQSSTPFSLPPASLPLAPWPAAHEAAALLQGSQLPLQHSVAAAVADPASLEGQPIVMRFSLKMYGLLPDQLPPYLHRELQSAIATSPTIITGTVRCGCTFLTADLLLSASEAEALAAPGGAAAALAHLQHAWHGGGGGGGWRPPALPALRVLAQAETAGGALLLQPLAAAAARRATLAPAGGGMCAVTLDAAQQQRLEVQVLGAAATTVGAARGRFVLRCPDWQQLVLGEAGAAARVLHCRSRGAHAALALLCPDVAEDGDGDGAVAEAAAGTHDSCTSCDEAEAAEEAEEARLRLRLQEQPGAEVWVAQAEEEWGLYEFELAAGSVLGKAAPVLVLPDGMEAEAGELQQLQAAAAAAVAAQPPGGGDARRLAGFTTQVLRLVNLVLVHQEEAAAAAAAGGAAAAAHAAAYPPAALQRMAAVATWLCALCMRCRYPALLRRLLPATTAVGDATGAVAAMDALLPAGVLGTAAAAGDAELLSALADWAAAAGYTWCLSGMGSRDLTPLHLAAAMGPSMSRAAADALVALVGAAAAAACWRGARAAGWTPRQVATAASNAALLGALGEPASEHSTPGPSRLASPLASGEAPALGDGPSSGAKARATQKLAELAAQEAAAQGAAAHVELEIALQAAEKKGDGGGSLGGSPSAAAAALRRAYGPPATAAQLAAWQQRPMQPVALLAMGGAAILVALGVVAALRAGIYG